MDDAPLAEGEHTQTLDYAEWERECDWLLQQYEHPSLLLEVGGWFWLDLYEENLSPLDAVKRHLTTKEITQ